VVLLKQVETAPCSLGDPPHRPNSAVGTYCTSADRQTSEGGPFASKKTDLIAAENSVVSSALKCIRMRAAVDLVL